MAGRAGAQREVLRDNRAGPKRRRSGARAAEPRWAVDRSGGEELGSMRSGAEMARSTRAEERVGGVGSKFAGSGADKKEPSLALWIGEVVGLERPGFCKKMGKRSRTSMAEARRARLWSSIGGPT